MNTLKPLPSVTDYLLLTGLATVLGLSFIFTAISVQDVHPVIVVWLRLLLATAILYPIMLRAKQKFPPWSSTWIYVVASALFGSVIPFTLISWGQTRIDAGLTAIFMTVMPLATIMLAHMFTADEKLNRWKFAGVMCGIFGIVVLMGPSALAGVGGSLPHQIAILLAAICYAINAIITRQLVALPKLPMITALMLCSLVIFTPFCFATTPPWDAHFTAQALWAIIASALGPTALATWLILVIIDRQGASFLSQINFMVPLFGVFFGAVFLHEVLSLNAWLALAIILTALRLSRQGAKP